MKRNFKLGLLLISVAFISCDKKDDSTSLTSSISSDGVISGTIVNYASSSIDSIKLEGHLAKSTLDRSAVSTAGKFSVTLSAPTLKKLGRGPKGVTVSDTTALVANLEQFYTYKNELRTGQIGKCNYTTDSVQTAGMSRSIFLYADRPTTIKGVEDESPIYGLSVDDSEILTYDVKLNKGWNELVTKIDVYSKTATSLTIKMTLTNTLTSDLQWRYFKSSSYYSVISKTKGQLGLKPIGFLFR